MRRCWALAIPMLLALVAAPAASATLAWSPATLIDGNGALTLNGVACPAQHQCTAIDSLGQAITFDPAAPANRSTSTVDLAGSTSGLACPSTAQCTAVDGAGNVVTFNPQSPGFPAPVAIDTGHGPVAIACGSTAVCTIVDHDSRELSFNPVSPGTPTPVVLSPVAGHTPTSIDCAPAADVCVAGDNATEEITFHPSSTAAPTPLAVEAGTHSLLATACVSATQCTVVDNQGLAFTFDPANPVYVPQGDGATTPTSLSCASGTQCTVVDTLGNEATFNPNGGLAPSPVAIETGHRLSGVSCPALTQCTAVDGSLGQALTFDPTTTTAPAPVKIDPAQALLGVSCPSPTQCTAVDQNRDAVTFNPLAPGNPTPVQIDPPPPSGVLNVNDVSCPLTTQCTAVDQSGRAVTFDPTNVGSPSPVMVDGTNSLSSVACPSKSECIAVDRLGNAVAFDPELGTVGTAVSVDSGHSLSRVSCPSPSPCTAVDVAGNAVTFTISGVVIGNSPHVFSIDAGQSLRALSCPSISQCTAVDGSGRQVTFDPSGAGTPSLFQVDPHGLAAISCMSTTDCVAVDFFGQAVEGDPASGNWTLEPIPGGNYFDAIDCSQGSRCVAVDQVGHVAVGSPVPIATAPPTISGTPQAGQMLTESHGTWLNAPTVFGYQWQDCDAGGANCTDIIGATGQTYVLTATDVGHTVRVSETASNGFGAGAPSSSATTAVVGAIPPGSGAISPGSGAITPSNTAAPTATGSDAAGNKLTASTGTWSGAAPITYAYQWQRCKKVCVNIGLATQQTYPLVKADVGARVRAVVTASNVGGGTSAISAQTQLVRPSDASVRKLLAKAELPAGKAGKLGAIRSARAYTAIFAAPVPGKLAIAWYEVPKGAHVAAKPKPVLEASASARFTRAGKGRVKIRLTAAGKRLLAHAGAHLRLTAKGTFTAPGSPAVVYIKAFAIGR